MSYIFHPVGRPTETPRPEDAALPSYYFRSRLSSKKCTNFRENYNIVFNFRSCTIYSNNICARTPKIKGNYPRSSSLPERARRCSSSSLRSCSHFNTRPRPKSSRLSMKHGVRGRSIKLFGVLRHASNRLFVSRGVRFPPPSLRAFLPRVRTSIVLASCGTDFASLQKFLISHRHNQAENCTYRKPGTGGGIRRSRTTPVPT